MMEITHGKACIMRNCLPARQYMQSLEGKLLQWDGEEWDYFTRKYKKFGKEMLITPELIKRCISRIIDVEKILFNSHEYWGRGIPAKYVCCTALYHETLRDGLKIPQIAFTSFFTISVATMNRYYNSYVEGKY